VIDDLDAPFSVPVTERETAFFWTRLREARSIALLGHISPDGDVVGSMIALHHVLHNLGLASVMVCQDPAPGYLRFLSGADRILSPFDPEIENVRFDVAVILDCSHPTRLGAASAVLVNAGTLFVIDHHADEMIIDGYHFVDIAASSTGEILHRLLRFGDLAIPPEAALGLYVAILMDTGSFRYGNTSADAMRSAAELLASGGIDVLSVGIHLFARETLPRLRLRGLAFDSAVLEDGIIHATITPEMRERAGASLIDGEGVIDELALCRDAEIAIVFWHLPDDVIRLQVRAVNTAEVLGIARAIGGGGHERAAGGRIRGANFEELRDRVLDVARVALAAQGLRSNAPAS
jgi:phosphoesterase RecJ-like protein